LSRPNLRVLAASTDIGSSITHIRVTDPLGVALAQRGGELHVMPYACIERKELARADVFVAQRAMGVRECKLIERMRALGGAVVYDIDDLLTLPAPHLKDRDQIARFRPWLLRCMQGADLVTVSTSLLGESLRIEPARLHLVPNSAAPESHGPMATIDSQAPVTLLLASSDRVAGGAAMQAVRDLQQKYGARLRVVGVGHITADLHAAGIDAQHHPLLSRPDFIALARSLINPLAVIPLDNSRFSACKSAIKWFDYAAVGVPTLASNVSPYREVMADGVTGALVGPRQEDWLAALEAAIGDAAWRRRITRAAHAEVWAKHGFDTTVLAWDEALNVAVERATHRKVWPTGRAQAAWASLLAWADSWVVALRRLNRQRLARRRALRVQR
jgi:O-antigen biosynthesis protein